MVSKIIKNFVTILFFVIGFIFISMSMANAEEKTITPKEFASNVAEVPSKVGNWFNNEVEKTKEYQAKSWAEMKSKWPFTMFKGNQ